MRPLSQEPARACTGQKAPGRTANRGGFSGHSQISRHIAGLEPYRPTHSQSLARQYRTGGTLGPVAAAVIEPPVYDPLLEMSRVYWAELEAATGPRYGPFPACGPEDPHAWCPQVLVTAVSEAAGPARTKGPAVTARLLRPSGRPAHTDHPILHAICRDASRPGKHSEQAGTCAHSALLTVARRAVLCRPRSKKPAYVFTGPERAKAQFCRASIFLLVARSYLV
jgi:hypothetical protein